MRSQILKPKLGRGRYSNAHTRLSEGPSGPPNHTSVPVTRDPDGVTSQLPIFRAGDVYSRTRCRCWSTLILSSLEVET